MRGLAVGVVVGAIVLVNALPAAAAPGAKAGTWATFTATSATLAPGFPDATITSTGGLSVATSETIVGTTPPGVVYGTSSGRTYLSLSTTTTSTTNSVTLTFATPTPASGWSVVLGDVDAEDVTVAGVTAGGLAVTAADLGLVETYTSGTGAAPSWDAGSLTVVGEHVDTAGASAWFSPTTSLTSITFTATQFVGNPAAWIWLVGHTASLAGLVTDATGAPVAGAVVELRAPDGSPLPGATPLTAGADGSFEFPAVVPAPVQVIATAPGGTPGAAVDVVPVAGAFPDVIDVTAPVPAVDPAEPELAASGVNGIPGAFAAVVLALSGLLLLGVARRRRTSVAS